MPTSYENQVDSLNPEIWFKFDEASGNATSSGNKTPTLTAYNTPTIGSTSTVSEKCVEYERTQSEYHYYNTSTTASTQMAGMNDGVFTLEWWIKVPQAIATSTNQVIWSIWSNADSNRQLGLYLRGTGVSNTGKLTYFTLRGGGGYQETITSSVVDDNKWHHIVVTQNGNTTKFYVDGVLETTKTDWSWTTFSWDAVSGIQTVTGAGVSNYSNPSFTEYYDGFLDEYAIYGSELTSSEILSNYYASGIADRYNAEVMATASPHAEFKDPLVSVNESNAADPMIISNAEFIDVTLAFTTDVNIAADPADISNSVFVDPTITVISNISISADPATADATFLDAIAVLDITVLANPADISNSQFVNPAISTESIISAAPALISNSTFVLPVIDVSESNSVAASTADATMGNGYVLTGRPYEVAFRNIDLTPYVLYRLNETSGDIATNSGLSGGGGAGDINISGTEGSAFAWVTGVDGNGLELKSNWAGFDSNSLASAQLVNMSIGFIFKRNGRPSSDSQVLYFFSDANNNFDTTSECRIESTDGKFHFNPTIGGSAGTTLVSDNDLCDDAWHHIIITRNGATLKLYVDGVENDSASNYNSTAQVTSGSFSFGGTAGNFFDEVFILDFTLNATQVLDLYRSVNPLVLADPMTTTLVTMEDPVISTTSDVSESWLSAEANAEAINPTILTEAIISVTPMEITNAEFIAGVIAVQQQIPADAMIATARVAIGLTGTNSWDGWDDDLTNFNKNADGWHGYGISNAIGQSTAPFVYGTDPLQGELRPFVINNSIWDTSSYNPPFTILHAENIFRNVEKTFGPDDDGIYALKGIENLEDVYFTGPDTSGALGANVVNFRTNLSSKLPTCVGYRNIGESSYTAADDLIKQFSYEFLFKTIDSNAILASGGVIDKDNLNAYWSEFRIENGYPVFEYIVTNNAGIKLKEFKFTGSTLVNTNEWIHLLIQTNKNDGFYQNLESLSELGDKYWSDPITLSSESFNTIDIYVNGSLSFKGELDYSDLYNDDTNVSIGNIHTIGRRFVSVLSTTRSPATPVYYCQSSTENRFTGTWAGMVKRSSTLFNTKLVGNNTSQSFVNGITSLAPEDVKLMSNLALRNRMRFIEENDGANAAIISPVVSTNTKKLLRLYFFGENATNEMFGVNSNLHNVVTYSVINEVSTDNDKLLNADKAYLGGAANPEIDSTEIVVDAWRNAQNYKRFINLQTDVEEYNDIDGIIFADYPDDGTEWSNLMPGYSDQWVSDQYDAFLISLRQAIDSGKGLYVSSGKLAADLNIVSNVTELNQEVETTVTITDPFADALGDTFYDTNRNNKYKIIAQEQDLTTLGSHIMTDFISHTGSLTDDYHIKYENRPNGLQINDQFIIPSLPLMKAQLITDLAGDVSNRLAENTLEVFAYNDILAGRPIAELGTTGYVTTIILEPGDILDDAPVGGKIIVNCVEDGLAMGLDEYNYGYRQVVSINDSGENNNTILWDYSTSRTTRQLEPLVISPDTKGQTYPSQGGGGPIVQAATHSSAANIRTKFDKANNTFTSGIYYDVTSEKYDLDRIPVYSMTYRGINWLMQPSDRQGTFVGRESAIAEATFVDPAVVYTEINVSLPPRNVSYAATPTTANAVLVTNITALYGTSNTITLTLHHQDVITLYIEKERL